MTTSCTDRDHPYYAEIEKIGTGEVRPFFTSKPHRMRFVSLGELLDFTSFGGRNYVVWPGLTVRDMAQFIQSWMEVQRPKIETKRVPDEKIPGVYRIEESSREYGYLWNRFDRDFEVELPVIRGDSCSKEGHNKKIQDVGGSTRCAEFQDDAGERTVCYQITSEGDKTLPLESILQRISVGHVFSGPVSAIFPFSGFEVANYTKSWWGQQGKKELLLPEGKKETYRVFADFMAVSSED